MPSERIAILFLENSQIEIYKALKMDLTFRLVLYTLVSWLAYFEQTDMK